MKNQRNFLHTIKQHSKRFALTSVLASTMLLPWRAAAADPLSFVEFTCVGYRVLSVRVADDGYPAGIARVLCRMEVYSLQTHTSTPDLLRQPPAYFSKPYEPKFAVDEAGLLPVFSW